ncbi:MAG: hypothetical protein HN392_13900 [Anaerolineae bacterium]|nr:hypothetical protein [Anaerolineae bacterium]MBT7075773.1 hypothetical protein [Anaerolineae bacterium]MBT7783677.1 hypothetical protein [Anaerolineae bacterium]
MKIIDKTPLVDADGSISTFNRAKGTLQYGFSWYPDLQAQEKAIALFKKQLGNKFTLIRNLTLGNSKITIPLILVGPPGIQVIFVTHVQGTYRAKNDAWGTITGGNFKEANINLLKRTAQLSKALSVYLKRNDVDLTDGIEPILLSTNPALHIASVRPIIRIVMSDAAERFVSSLTQEPPIMSLELIHKITETLINPKPPKAKPQEKKEAPAQSPAETSSKVSVNNKAISNKRAPSSSPSLVKTPAPIKKATETYLGMTGKQLALIGIMGLILICLLVLLILGVVFFL